MTARRPRSRVARPERLCAGGEHAATPGSEARSSGVPAATTAYWNRIPRACHALDVSVSTSGRWARVQSVFTPTERCVRFASDGYYVLRRPSSSTWRIVLEGSDLPPCSLGVPRDLVRGCSRL